MHKRIVFLVVLATGLVICSTVQAQGPVTPQYTDPTWTAAYWNNTDLSGPATLARKEADIAYNWQFDSPVPGVVHADRFSVRWTRYIDVAPGTYWFTVTSDDGVRLWVDGELILDRWYDHSAETFSVDKSLDAGYHLVQLEYYENRGAALVELSWMRGNVDVGTWRGEYFNNSTLSGDPILVREDVAIDFDWGTGSPYFILVDDDLFSVRWTRTLEFRPEVYRFTVTADDGARLWVNDRLLIDAWRDQPPTTYNADIYLTGFATIEMHYYENMGGATARLSWLPLGGEPEPPVSEVVIVDDADSGFVRGGSPAGWRTAREGYGGRLTWTTNNDILRPNYNWGRWDPRLSPGQYEVFAFVPFRYTTTVAARYQISHEAGLDERIIDQSEEGGDWVSLGTYYFGGTANDYVLLSDVTGEPYRSRLIAFDAIKWESR
jgi:hypothetical protein